MFQETTLITCIGKKLPCWAFLKVISLPDSIITTKVVWVFPTYIQAPLSWVFGKFIFSTSAVKPVPAVDVVACWVAL